MADLETELDIELIKRRSMSGIVTLTLRTFFIFIFSYIAWFILTIVLDESTYGIFFVVQSMLNILIYFSDIGLAAALVQKKGNLSKTDLSTTFTIQQVIILTIVFLGLAFSSKIANFYHLDYQGLTLFRILVFSLFLSSLKTIPSILLERDLKFTRFVIPQIAEQLVFFTTAVVLALLNFKIASFYWAVLLRGIVGLILIYILSPWKPSLSFNKESAKKLISFGIPFQVNSILALLKDDLLVLFLGKALPFSQVGYIGWSQKVSQLPLRFFLDNVNKVTFPAYSRLQNTKDHLAKAVEKSLFFITYLVFPAALGIAAIAPVFVEVIPKYSKWAPALPLLYLFSLNTAIAAISTTFTNVLFAIGRPQVVLRLMIFWVIITWGLTVPLISKFGYLGVGLASLFVSLTSLSTIYFVKREINVNIGKNIFGPLISSLFMFVSAVGLLRLFPHNFFGLIFVVILGAIIYFAVSFAILKNHLKEDFFVILKSLMNKS